MWFCCTWKAVTLGSNTHTQAKSWQCRDHFHNTLFWSIQFRQKQPTKTKKLKKSTSSATSAAAWRYSYGSPRAERLYAFTADQQIRKPFSLPQITLTRCYTELNTCHVFLAHPSESPCQSSVEMSATPSSSHKWRHSFPGLCPLVQPTKSYRSVVQDK